MKKKLLLFSLGLFSLAFSNVAEAKTENEYYTIEYNQCYSEAPPLYDSSDQNESRNPSMASVTVTFDVRAYNNSTGALIAENETVPANTQVRFGVDLQNNTNISWYITGTDLDSPYGEWSDALPGQYPFRYNNSCGYGGESFKETFVTRPSLNFNHSGSTAPMTCNSNGSLCTVTGAGTLATSIAFSPISMGFGGHGVGVFPGYEGPRMRTFNYGPTITYPIQVSGPTNNPPVAPSITGATSGNPGLYTFSFQATDPDSDQIKYGIDWDNSGSVDQWIPTSGHVNSNTAQGGSFTWNAAGNYTFKALTQDNKGAQSAWSTHTIILTPAPTPTSTVNLTINGSDGPLDVIRGSTLNISWSSANVLSCNAWGAGWGSGGVVSTTGVSSTTANQTDTYILQCSNGTTTITDSVQVNLTNSLKICQNSCSSGVMRGSTGNTGSFTLASGGNQSLVACFNSSSDCSEGNGDITGSASWSEGGSNVVSLSGTSPKLVTGNNAGTESVTASYSSQSATTNVSVACVPTVSCNNASGSDNTCESDTFTVDNGCGVSITCNGTKTCDYNWKEVAP